MPGISPVGVIDIGSNSVRLVVYEGLTRSLTPIFNEKALCGLGAHLATTGRLDADAVASALVALRRFRALADQMQVDDLHVIATAAAREAENGDAFVAEAQAICEVPVNVLTGSDEALYAAYGIMSGLHEPDGIVGDLGGGSLELSDIRGDSNSGGVSLPLGVLRLHDLTEGNFRKADDIIATTIKDSGVAAQGMGRDFYAIGGTFRSMAKMHMARADYPLHVMHNYVIEIDDARDFVQDIQRGKLNALLERVSMSDIRQQLLPYGAAVMQGVLEVVRPRRIVISALGVREGLLYGLLAESERARDPLVIAAEELAYLRSRSPRHARELIRWTDRLFVSLDIEETASEVRLRHAALLLSDIGWRAHPDYRGEQSVNIIANAAFVGIDHASRIFMALCVSHRHTGLGSSGLPPKLESLAPAHLRERARIIGGALRVAYLVTASTAGVLDETPIYRDGDTLVLSLPRSREALAGKRVASRLKHLAKVLSLSHEIRINGSS